MTQFSEKQLLAIDLLSVPDKGGMKFDEIAEKCGISVRQLHRWRKNPEFKQAIVQVTMENAKAILPDVVKAHEKQATRGNVKAIELFYKVMGLLIERQEVEQNVTHKGQTNDDLNKQLDDLKGLIDRSKGE